MSPLQIISTIFVSVSLLLAGYKPGTDLSFVAICSMLLFGAVCYLENRQDDELNAVKEELKSVKASVQALMVRAGFGR